MKKFFLTPLLFLFPLIMLAQVCTPDSQYSTPGIYPDSSVNIPPACVGVLYEQTITIIVEDNVNGITINSVTLLNVDGLPAGFTYQCEPANCTFLPNTPYCILLSGTPGTADIGTYDISFEVEASGSFLGNPITQTTEIEDFYELIVGENPTVDAGMDLTINDGDSIQIGGQPLATGGTAPYTYIWSSSATLSDPAAANPYASPTTTTTYQVIATDQNGCTASDDLTVEVLGTLFVNAGPDVDACEMDSTYVGVDLTFSGGVEPYSYSWFDESGSLISTDTHMVFYASPFYEGTYTVIVEDANGLIGQDELEFNVFLRPIVSLFYDDLCRVDEEFTISGGTPAGGTYYINDIQPNTFNPFSHPQNSIQFKYVYDDGICVDSAFRTVQINDLPQVDAGSDTTIFVYEVPGEIVLNATGGIEFVWSPGEFLNDSTIANPLATIEETTVFSVMAIDVNGCSNTDEIEVIIELINNTMENLVNQSIDIYPNPVGDFINLRAKTNMNYPLNIELFDLNGKLIKTAIWSAGASFQLNTIDLNQGIYLLNIGNAESVNTYKIVIK